LDKQQIKDTLYSPLFLSMQTFDDFQSKIVTWGEYISLYGGKGNVNGIPYRSFMERDELLETLKKRNNLTFP
jgi:hypothetical protein